MDRPAQGNSYKIENVIQETTTNSADINKNNWTQEEELILFSYEFFVLGQLRSLLPNRTDSEITDHVNKKLKVFILYLLKEVKNDKKGKNLTYEFVWNKILSKKPKITDISKEYILGLINDNEQEDSIVEEGDQFYRDKKQTYFFSYPQNRLNQSSMMNSPLIQTKQVKINNALTISQYMPMPNIFEGN